MMWAKNNAANKRINNNKTITSKFFEYKRKLIGATTSSNNILDAEVVVPLRRSLGLPLINCEVELDLSWPKECIISEISIILGIASNSRANPLITAAAAIQTIGATFQINSTKLYSSVKWSHLRHFHTIPS